MAGFWTDLGHDGRIAAASLREAATDLWQPNVRLGVTGLARAGKTVFITALVQALITGQRLPLFTPSAEGRLLGARLSPQPDDTVPRFDAEGHLADLVAPERRWPDSTRRIAELRLVVDYRSASFFGRTLGPSRLTIDIVDYPGEWLLDLGLLNIDYAAWSRTTLALAAEGTRRALAEPYTAALAAVDPAGPLREEEAGRLARLFTAYLRACRADPVALSTLPPGRFLLPGDLEGSPALTFAPLPEGERAPPGSLRHAFERRFEAYKAQIVRPFFRDHFARIDRQIVLVDVLHALNAGPQAVRDLERALTDVLQAFRVGRASWWASLVQPRADRVVFAATKADHLHQRDHDRLEAILARLVARARARAGEAGAEVAVLALAALRATREATIHEGSRRFEAIVGTPLAGERLGEEVFDGRTEAALFPGDLPDDPESALTLGRDAPSPEEAAIRFVRFRPPPLAPRPEGGHVWPHIRLDRALDILLADKLA